MANRYQELFRLPQLLFSEGCPVIIEVAVIQKDTVSNRVLAQIKLCNLSTKILTACKVCVKAYEPSGREIEGVPDFCYLDLCAAAGAEFGAKTPVYLPNAATRKISVSVINAVFGDGSVWNGEPCEWEQAPEQETIAEHFPDPEMQKQAALEIGKDCVFFPAIRRGLFQCACGTVNLGADRRCRTCGRTFAELIAALDKKTLMQKKNARLQTEAEERAAAEKAAESARLAAESRKKKVEKIAAIIAPIVCVCAVFAVLLMKVIIPNGRYSAAVELYNAGRYEDAIEAFAALDGYKDSTEQIANCKYSIATDLYNAGKYEEAIEAFTAMDGYKDSTEKADEIYKQYEDGELKNAKVGDVIIFGAYEQDNDTSNGKEEIEWLVLAKEDNRVLVISKYALDCQPYYKPYMDVTWETCTLRTWLNNDFLNTAFLDEEQLKLQSTIVSADINPKYSTDPGNNTKDVVFLLSISEAEEYFAGDEGRMCFPTKFAAANGAYVDDENGACHWWLRSPGGRQSVAAYVCDDGVIECCGRVRDLIGQLVLGTDIAVRPAMWIDLEA